MTWWSLVDQFARDFRHGARVFVLRTGTARRLREPDRGTPALILSKEKKWKP